MQTGRRGIVWPRMGLLDDAIREHLELKRRRGADPGEVAREQHEALDPVPRERAAEAEEGGLPTEQVLEPGAHAGPGEESTEASNALPVAAHTTGSVEPAAVGETAELDMRTVLGEDGEDGEAGEPAAQAEAEGSAPLAEEDSLEWEVPTEAAGTAEAEELDDDVLEETPDFLRDTPEQDRLWFEQRPPRDFDFDK